MKRWYSSSEIITKLLAKNCLRKAYKGNKMLIKAKISLKENFVGGKLKWASGIA